jgi:hypothetical protein
MPVMIGVDPHKGSHTAVVVGEAERNLGELRVRSGPSQVDRLMADRQVYLTSGLPDRRGYHARHGSQPADPTGSNRPA